MARCRRARSGLFWPYSAEEASTSLPVGGAVMHHQRKPPLPLNIAHLELMCSTTRRVHIAVMTPPNAAMTRSIICADSIGSWHQVPETASHDHGGERWRDKTIIGSPALLLSPSWRPNNWCAGYHALLVSRKGNQRLKPSPRLLAQLPPFPQ